MLEKRDTVAFSAYRSNSQSLSNGEIVIFDGVWTNVGNGYVRSIGVFKAPNPGLYHLTAVVISTDGKSLRLNLYHNRVRMTRSYLTGDGFKTGTFDVVIHLQMGDKVYIDSDQIRTIVSNSNKYVTFSGIKNHIN
ncbi:complement C1q-like protein 4 [Mytilus trossulus]|uniref:complement C1q-like protein 4 n=1 Tax=Mytilus trossulus TaxID=6551 RepID=UPI0030052C2A